MSVEKNEELKKQFKEKFENDVPKRYSLDDAWILSKLTELEKEKIQEEQEEKIIAGSQGFGFIIQKNVQFKGRIWKVGEKIKSSELGDKIEEFKKREIIK